jgi:hypothetical protein
MLFSPKEKESNIIELRKDFHAKLELLFISNNHPSPELLVELTHEYGLVFHNRSYTIDTKVPYLILGFSSKLFLENAVEGSTSFDTSRMISITGIPEDRESLSQKTTNLDEEKVSQLSYMLMTNSLNGAEVMFVTLYQKND